MVYLNCGESRWCSLHTVCLLVCFAGTLAVPDAAAQGHGDPGRGADAEGPAGHRWWHPGCPGAHICWRPGTLRPGSPHRLTELGGKKCWSTEIINQGFNKASFFFLLFFLHTSIVVMMILWCIPSSFSFTDWLNLTLQLLMESLLVTSSMLHVKFSIELWRVSLKL